MLQSTNNTTSSNSTQSNTTTIEPTSDPWDKDIDWKFWAMYGGGGLVVLLIITSCCFICYCIRKSNHEEVTENHVGPGKDDDSLELESSEISSFKDTEDSS